MNTEKALNMIEQYILSDCTDLEWRKCLQHLKWLVVHQQELIDEIAAENERFREQIKAYKQSLAENRALLDAAVAGQETLQKYHHNETEQAYKNGYNDGALEFAVRVREKLFYCDLCYGEDSYRCGKVGRAIIDAIVKELTGGSENDKGTI